MVREDARVTYKNIEASLRIGSGSVVKFLYIYLRVSKVSSRWVPHSLSDGQKITWVEWCCEMLRRYNNGNSCRDSEIITGDETCICQYDPETKCHSSAWGFPNDDRPVKVKRAKSVGKKMELIFFAVATVPLEHQRTVTAQWYTTVALPQVLQKLREKRPRAGLRGILLHYYNASAHATHLTMNFLKGLLCGCWPILLTVQTWHLGDFFLFPTVKARLPGKRFPTPEGVVATYQGESCALDYSDWHQYFESWFRRMRRCIDAQGEYFEKM